MNIFKKKKISDAERHPDEVIQEATDNINKLTNQIKPEFYSNDRNEFFTSYKIQKHNEKLKLKIAHEETRKELAEKRSSNPTPPPQNVHNDYRRTKITTITATASVGDVGSNNKKGVNDNLKDNQIANNTRKAKKQTTTAPIEIKKKSKAKLIFYSIFAVLVLVGVITLTIYITNCVRDIQDNSSSAYYEITI